MNSLRDLLRQREYKKALVWLWALGQTLDPGGGTVCTAQWIRQYDSAAHHELKEHLLEWLENGCREDQALDAPARARALLSALDHLLADQLRDAPYTAFDIPITAPTGRQVWLLPRMRAPGQGYLGKEPPDSLPFFHPHHILLPVQATHLELTLPINIAQGSPLTRWPQPIRVAVAAFADTVVLKPESPGTSLHYLGTTNEEARLTAALSLIARAEAEQAHILLFPELTLSPTCQSKLRQKLDARRLKGTPSPLLMIGLGSFHETQQDPALGPIRRNRARLVSGRDGREWMWQDKLRPANPQGVIEDFQPAAGVNALLLPIGLVTIAICKDLFDEHAKWLWPLLSPEWLLSPSMTEKLGEHEKATRELWNRHRCICLVANQPPQPGMPGCASYIQRAKEPDPALSDLHVVEIDPSQALPQRPRLRIVQPVTA